MGVIDTLSAGFAIIARRPGVMLIPLALNFFLWLGPQISVQPLFQQIAGALALPPTVTPSPDLAEMFDSVRIELQTIGQTLNLFEILGLAMPGLIPIGGDSSVDPKPMARNTLISISDTASLIGIGAGLLLIGFFLVALYMEGIARSVRPVSSQAPVLKSYVRITTLVILLGLVGMAVAVPFLTAAALIAPFNPGIGSFIIMLVFIFMLWVLLYLSFAIPAIFVSGAGARQAIAHSVAVFRFNFRSAMGLVLMVYLIQSGLSVVWDQLSGSDWGIVVDIAANAFIASGLIAAVMLFYRDRVQWMAQARAQVRPSLKGQ